MRCVARSRFHHGLCRVLDHVPFRFSRCVVLTCTLLGFSRLPLTFSFCRSPFAFWVWGPHFILPAPGLFRFYSRFEIRSGLRSFLWIRLPGFPTFSLRFVLPLGSPAPDLVYTSFSRSLSVYVLHWIPLSRFTPLDSCTCTRTTVCSFLVLHVTSLSFVLSTHSFAFTVHTHLSFVHTVPRRSTWIPSPFVWIFCVCVHHVLTPLTHTVLTCTQVLRLGWITRSFCTFWILFLVHSRTRCTVSLHHTHLCTSFTLTVFTFCVCVRSRTDLSPVHLCRFGSLHLRFYLLTAAPPVGFTDPPARFTTPHLCWVPSRFCTVHTTPFVYTFPSFAFPHAPRSFTHGSTTTTPLHVPGSFVHVYLFLLSRLQVPPLCGCLCTFCFLWFRLSSWVLSPRFVHCTSHTSPPYTLDRFWITRLFSLVRLHVHTGFPHTLVPHAFWILHVHLTSPLTVPHCSLRSLTCTLFSTTVCVHVQDHTFGFTSPFHVCCTFWIALGFPHGLHTFRFRFPHGSHVGLDHTFTVFTHPLLVPRWVRWDLHTPAPPAHLGSPAVYLHTTTAHVHTGYTHLSQFLTLTVHSFTFPKFCLVASRITLHGSGFVTLFLSFSRHALSTFLVCITFHVR